MSDTTARSDLTRALRPHVLVVEDEPRMREMLVRTVSELSLPVSAARSAEEAASVLATEPMNILLLDLNLPGIDGLAFLQQARLLRPHLQAIVITGFGSLKAAQAAIHLDVVDFITKPFILDDLDAALSRAQQRLRAATLQHAPVDTELPGVEDDEDVIRGETLKHVERQYILAALARNNGNRAATARELGISERTLYYRIGQYNRRHQSK